MALAGSRMKSLALSRHLTPTISSVAYSESLNSIFPATASFSFSFSRWGHPARSHRCSVAVCAKKSYFQDFQDYVKPTRLLPTKEPTLSRDEPPERIISSLQSDSESLYKILLRTSSIYGSGLTNLNAGVLVCIADENGDCALQRIPSILSEDDITHFQRGSTDEFLFCGPKLARIQAMWISVESGNWRLAGASLTVITAHNDQAEQYSDSRSLYCTVLYEFEDEDVMLGEGSDALMVELRPCLVKEYRADSIQSVNNNFKQAESLVEQRITNEDSMIEYANLKYSLLLYDAILIFAGTSISSFTAGENTALAFLTGGIGGFLYLLLLQRSVDRLPTPELNSLNQAETFGKPFQGLKGPLLVLAFSLGMSVLVARRDMLGFEPTLTPKDIVVGTMGFLACKVSVLLAAFKPMSIIVKDSNS